MKYEGDNPILRYFAIVRPQLWEPQTEDFTKVAFVLHHAIAEGKTANWDDVTDALAELVPEQREFWLRVQATWNTQFMAGMAAMFESEPDKVDDGRLSPDTQTWKERP